MDLIVTLPVFNEEGCIAEVVSSWREALARLGIRFRILILNDGSTDGTRQVLDQFAGDDRIEVIHKPNSGHGPTLLQGYRRAVSQAEWVFQCDSDNEMSPEAFPRLWEKRERYDALFGVRKGRKQNRGRALISAVSRGSVRLLFGPGVTDVNTPYRLMRARLLEAIVAQIPADTFAPNVIISGALAQARLRIWNEPVEHRGRKTGRASIVKWKLWKAAFRSFVQTLRCHPRISPEGGGAPPPNPKMESP